MTICEATPDARVPRPHQHGPAVPLRGFETASDDAWQSNLERLLAVTRRYFDASLHAAASGGHFWLKEPAAGEAARRLALRGAMVARFDPPASRTASGRASKRMISSRT